MSGAGEALHRTLKAAPLFWKLLSKKLVGEGFKINSHDWCIANKMIHGKHMMVLRHMDDNYDSDSEVECVLLPASLPLVPL